MLAVQLSSVALPAAIYGQALRKIEPLPSADFAIRPSLERMAPAEGGLPAQATCLEPWQAPGQQRPQSPVLRLSSARAANLFSKSTANWSNNYTVLGLRLRSRQMALAFRH